MIQIRVAFNCVLTLAIVFPLIAPPALTAAIVAHWRLDSNAADTQGTHPGTLVGSDYRWDTNDFAAGTASLRLNSNNASSSYIFVADAADFTFGTNDFSVSYWVKKMQLGANYLDAYGVGKWKAGGTYPGQNEWTLDVETGSSDNTPLFAVEIGPTTYGVSSATNLTLGSWAHLVATRRTNTISIYVNGALQGRSTIPANATVNTNQQGLYIGNSAALIYGANAFYDDVQVYNHALSDGGISSIGQLAGGEIGILWNDPGAEILSGPVILAQPASQAVGLTGGTPPSVSFTVLAAGTAPLKYQWRFNENPLASATSATYTVPSVTTNQFGLYDVQITNNYGSVTSAPARLSAPDLLLDMVPGLTVEGVVGSTARIDYSVHPAGTCLGSRW